LIKKSEKGEKNDVAEDTNSKKKGESKKSKTSPRDKVTTERPASLVRANSKEKKPVHAGLKERGKGKKESHSRTKSSDAKVHMLWFLIPITQTHQYVFKI